jgi:hypothetical protein
MVISILMTMCVRENEKPVMELGDSAMLVTMHRKGKDKLISFVCYDSNMINVNINTSWIYNP